MWGDRKPDPERIVDLPDPAERGWFYLADSSEVVAGGSLRRVREDQCAVVN
jgi:hypothetical protein